MNQHIMENHDMCILESMISSLQFGTRHQKRDIYCTRCKTTLLVTSSHEQKS